MTSSRPPSLRELNRTLLARQFLLERSQLPVRRVVARLVALQAQYAPSPYVALWSRIAGFRKEQLTHALERGTIVKAGLFRTTLHVVDASLFPDVASSYAESVRGKTKHRLDVSLFPDRPMMRKEYEEYASSLIGSDDVWEIAFALRPLPSVRAAPTGLWPHTKPSPSVLWRERLPDAAEASARIVRAYLAAYGPATRDDVQQFTGFKVSQIAPALERLRCVEGYYDVPRAVLVDAGVRAPVRFLPAFDSIILAHRDRARILPDEYRDTVINKKNATTKNTFTVDGFVAGTWRMEGTKLRLDPFAPLPPKWRREVEAEGERLRAWYAA